MSDDEFRDGGGEHFVSATVSKIRSLMPRSLIDYPGRTKWSKSYRELVVYHERNGDCLVPKTEGKLGRWVARQREQYRKNELPTQRQQLLESIGFVWNTSEFLWDSRYEQLQDYYQRHGNSRVPTAERDLGVWVAKQRQLQRQGKLLPERKARLDLLQFVWSTPTREWNKKYEALVKWKNVMGHCRVPFNEGELGWWVGTQRQRKRKGQLAKDREDKLNEIGFIWNPQNNTAFENGAPNSSIDNLLSPHPVGSASDSPNISTSSSYRRRKRRLSNDGSDSMGSKRHHSDLSERSNSVLPPLRIPENSSQSSFDSFRDSSGGSGTPVFHAGTSQDAWHSATSPNISNDELFLPPLQGIRSPVPPLSTNRPPSMFTNAPGRDISSRAPISSRWGFRQRRVVSVSDLVTTTPPDARPSSLQTTKVSVSSLINP